jgi:hypothetical protein
MREGDIMKWSDIPQFPTARYEIDVSWMHLERGLKDIAGEGEIRLDPDYQRAHVWTSQQQIDYVEFQLSGGDVSRTLVFNAPFWDRISEVPFEDQYVELLDGKQRLEAVRAFLRGDIAVFGQKFDEFEGPFPTMNYRFRFHVCCLETRVEVLELYLKINAGGTPHSQQELDRVRGLLEVEREK